MSGYHAGASTAAAQLSSWQSSLQSVPASWPAPHRQLLPVTPAVPTWVAATPVTAIGAAERRQCERRRRNSATTTGAAETSGFQQGQRKHRKFEPGQREPRHQQHRRRQAGLGFGKGNDNFGSGNLGSANHGNGNVGSTTSAPETTARTTTDTAISAAALWVGQHRRRQHRLRELRQRGRRHRLVGDHQWVSTSPGC